MNLDSGGKPPDIGPTGAITGIGTAFSNANPGDDDHEMSRGFPPNRDKSKQTQETGNGSGNPDPKIKTKFYYEKNDLGPYHVYIENNSTDFKGKLNAIKVNDIIYNLHIELDNKIKEIESIGRNRVRINFKDSKSANSLVDSNLLKDQNLEAYIPKFNILRKGVISGIDTELDNDTLKNKIKQFDAHCNFTILYVQRITKTAIDEITNQKKYINTRAVIVTFKTQTLPKYIAIGHVRCEVRPYTQRVIMCYNCYRYGHTSKQCKSNIRCPNCAEQHNANECPVQVSDITCLNCNGRHKTNELKKCPEFSRQKNIKKAMAEKNISYKDAEKYIPRETYATIAARIKNTDITDVDLGDWDNTLDQSLSQKKIPSQHQSTRFTLTKTPTKRNRVSSPVHDIHSQHKQILLQHKIQEQGTNILNDQIYKQGIATNNQKLYSTTGIEQNINTNKIVELVISILNILKENNTFDINKSEIERLINYKMTCTDNN